jgi:hypothetical protein
MKFYVAGRLNFPTFSAKSLKIVSHRAKLNLSGFSNRRSGGLYQTTSPISKRAKLSIPRFEMMAGARPRT